MAKKINETVFEDISSSTSNKKIDLKATAYSEGAYKNIDKVVKAIAYIVSVCTFLIFAAIAVVLVIFDSIFLILSMGLIIFGVSLSLILLFLIYAIGHIISQNREILKRL